MSADSSDDDSDHVGASVGDENDDSDSADEGSSPEKKLKIVNTRFEFEEASASAGSRNSISSPGRQLPSSSLGSSNNPSHTFVPPSTCQPSPSSSHNVITTKVKHKSSDVLGRKKQFQLLKAALGNVPHQALPGAIFLWGPPSSGKSYTLERALEETHVHIIKIHSAEILCGRRAFYETLVKQLVSCSGRTLTSDFKCDSLHSLFSNFTLFFEKNRSTHVTVIIEGAEGLRGEYDDILQFLVTLQDITQGPVCISFISTLPPGMFMPNVLDHAIIPLYFPQYSMDELTQIICDRKESHLSTSRGDGCYNFYVKMIVSMFYYVCRDLRKLLRLANNHWEVFKRMVDDSVDINLTKLWKKLEPQLKSQFFEMNSTIATKISDNEQENPGRTLAMPANSKYLLIAAYLATHNPPSSDKRFFVKSRTGRAKKSRGGLKTDVNNGFARSFELNRLNAIFGSIQVYCDDKAVNRNRNISFMTALTTLCQKKLVQHLGEDSTGNQKYKCLLDYDTVLNISRSVNFELNSYLYRLL